MTMLEGKKTYAAAIGLAVLAAYQLFWAGDVAQAGQSLMAALAAFGLRSALVRKDKAEPTPQQPPTVTAVTDEDDGDYS